MNVSESESISRDRLSPEARSRNMAKVRSHDTKPEKLVRSLLHRAGFRFRKNAKELPGCPDVVLPRYRTVIFVHGCFWHRHDCPKGRSVPANRRDFWVSKLERNAERDKENQQQLRDAGWRVLVVWECELKQDAEMAFERLADQIRG